MTDLRQVSKRLRDLSERAAIQWMNDHFPDALTVIEEKDRKEEEDGRVGEGAASSQAFLSCTSPSPSSRSSSPSFRVADAVWLNGELRMALKSL
jgi:hypothetical protein